jgi:large subunit ribosomal protein L17
MRHRRRGRKLGRAPAHQRALLRSLASNLILTLRDAQFDPNPPSVQGRIITTLAKAKEVRPLVERCITIARRSLAAEARAEQFAPPDEPQSEAWRRWRQSADWRKWNAAMAPAVAARRRVLSLLGNKQAMRLLFDDLALRFEDRPGGYTRIVRLAKPRVGDAGTRAILEFVGVRDRVAAKAPAPDFESPEAETSAVSDTPAAGGSTQAESQ